MATNDPQLEKAVRDARAELTGVVDAVKAALTGVANANTNAQQQAQAQAPGQTARTLADVLRRVQVLKHAVAEATRAGERQRAREQAREDAVTPAERDALVRRRDALVAQVQAKNKTMRVLIDDLRELHRDIAVLISVFKDIKTQQRVR